MADNIRSITSSFSTLSNASLSTKSTGNYASAIGVANLVSDTANSVSALADVADSIPSYLLSGTDVSINGLKEDVVNTYTALTDSTSNYLNEKYERLKKLWNTKVDVTIESIIGEVTSFAVDLDDIGGTLLKKLTSFIGTITGTNLSDADSFIDGVSDGVSTLWSDYFTALSADGSLKETINQLNSVKTVATTLNTAVQIYNAVVKIKKVYEELSNTLSIASGFAMTYWSGGTSAVEAVNTTANVAQRNISKLKTLLLYTLKKFIFPIKVKLPQLLVGNTDSLTVKEAMMSSSVWGGLFTDEYYETVRYTQAWEKAVKNAINDVRTASSKVVGTAENYEQVIKRIFQDNYMSEITALSRKTAGIKDFPTETAQSSNESNSSTKSSSAWQAVWGDKASLTPINSVESLIKVSATLYGAIE